MSDSDSNSNSDSDPSTTGIDIDTDSSGTAGTGGVSAGSTGSASDSGGSTGDPTATTGPNPLCEPQFNEHPCVTCAKEQCCDLVVQCLFDSVCLDLAQCIDGGGTFDDCEPWYFNHSWESVPMTLFYDGHVEGLGVREAEQADGRADAQSGYGLWSRDTPMGADGYFIDFGYDFSETSFHVLTTDGIRGRDKIGDG